MHVTRRSTEWGRAPPLTRAAPDRDCADSSRESPRNYTSSAARGAAGFRGGTGRDALRPRCVVINVFLDALSGVLLLWWLALLSAQLAALSTRLLIRPYGTAGAVGPTTFPPDEDESSEEQCQRHDRECCGHRTAAALTRIAR